MVVVCRLRESSMHMLDVPSELHMPRQYEAGRNAVWKWLASCRTQAADRKDSHPIVRDNMKRWKDVLHIAFSGLYSA